ncbi:hypothetical protein HDZ31DRAFT_49242 [Schizophyllum fasciatum]
MFTADNFRTFPPGPLTLRAEDDIERFGENTAICGEWQRRHFAPLITQLRDWITVVDRMFARKVLELSHEWHRFERSMRDLKLPPQDQQAVLKTTLNILELLGEYWSNYHLVLEKRQPEVLWVAIDDSTDGKVARWLRKANVDPVVLKEQLSAGGKTATYWDIFRMGLRHHVYDDERWYRFVLLSRCLARDISDLGFIQDPVSVGGAVAYYDMEGFYVEDTRDRLSYLTSNVTLIIDHIREFLHMSDACAAQAICVFLDAHPL